MLKALHLTKFRAFDDYEFDSLARVNLVVGKNNSGKTSLLEAVELLVSNGNPATISDAAKRRAEMHIIERRSLYREFPSIAHMFHDHACEPGASFEIRSPHERKTVTAEVRSLDQLDEKIVPSLIDESYPPEADVAMGLAIRVGEKKSSEKVFPVTEEGLLIHDVRRRWRTGVPALFLSLTSMDLPYLGDAWNALVTEGRELEIVEDMRFLMPDIESIHFLTADA